jgi:transcriptional regulator with XRE-family HTH domain
MPKTHRLTVADYLTKAIELSGKTQREVAREVGYEKPNVVSMMKQGQTRIPLEKAPLFARACGVDPTFFLRLVLEEYHPEAAKIIHDTLGEPPTENERKLIDLYRRAAPLTEIEITPARETALLEALGSKTRGQGRRHG